MRKIYLLFFVLLLFKLSCKDNDQPFPISEISDSSIVGLELAQTIAENADNFMLNENKELLADISHRSKNSQKKNHQ